jgi:hypothetical protein
VLSFTVTKTHPAMASYPDEKIVGIPQAMRVQELSAEDAELAKLGYKQEFTRDFSWFSTFSFAFSISGLLATVCSQL